MDDKRNMPARGRAGKGARRAAGGSAKPAAVYCDGDVKFGFSSQAAVVSGSWLQERYHSDAGETVREFLAFRRVFDINPFETGVSHGPERRAYREMKKFVDSQFSLGRLSDRCAISLSNGETFRLLLARTVLRRPSSITFESPFGGLDPEGRAWLGETARKLGEKGVRVDFSSSADRAAGAGARRWPARSGRSAPGTQGAAVVEMRDIALKLGRRTLFEGFSWTVREGERWILRGPNGSGKTTLFALMTGDSPYAYACDVRLFGLRRGAPGVALAPVRSRIGIVSAERQAYLGQNPEEQFEKASAASPSLLLLDEPFYNLAPRRAERLKRKIEEFLEANPKTAAICVAHRPDAVPRGFGPTLDLGRTAARRDGASGV